MRTLYCTAIIFAIPSLTHVRTKRVDFGVLSLVRSRDLAHMGLFGGRAEIVFCLGPAATSLGRFDRLEILPGFDVFNFLYNPRWPPNFDQFGAGIFAESRDHTFITGGEIADCRIDRKVLRHSRSRHDLDSCSDAVAIGFRAHKLNADPVVSISAVILE